MLLIRQFNFNGFRFHESVQGILIQYLGGHLLLADEFRVEKIHAAEHVKFDRFGVFGLNPQPW